MRFYLILKSERGKLRGTFGVTKRLSIKEGPCRNDTLTINFAFVSECCPWDKTHRPIITRLAMSFSKVRHAVSAETCALPDTYHTFGGKFITHARFYLHVRARAHADVSSLYTRNEGRRRPRSSGRLGSTEQLKVTRLRCWGQQCTWWADR